MKMGRYHFVLFLIVLLGLLLRLYHLDTVPNGFFFDEATISYQAYSLLKTGRDTWTNAWPLLSFKDYGEYILPLGIYGQMPSIFLGGLTVFAARLPHAVLGAITVFLVYVLGRVLFDRRIGLLAALLLAVQPLSLGWSRFVFEGNFGTVFFLNGIILFVGSFRRQVLFPIALIFFGLSMLSYHIFLMTTPIFVFLGLICFRRKIGLNARLLSLSLAIVFIFGLWSLAAIYSGAGRQRFGQAATLLTAEKLDVLNHQIGYCRERLPGPFCRLFFNRYGLSFSSYAENYISHFSPAFLGFDGSFLRRNILPRTGIIQTVEVAAFFIGIYFLVKSKDLGTKVSLVWLLVYPLANSFTGVGEISRIAFAAPLFSLVSAYGLGSLWAVSKKATTILMLAIVTGALGFLASYFSFFPITNAYYTNFGYDRVFRWVRENKGGYDHIFISRNYAGSVPYISALFFLPLDPGTFAKGKVERIVDERGYYIMTRIDSLFFYGDIKELALGSRDFIIATPEEIGRGVTPEFTIIDPTGRILFVGVSADDYLNQEI